MAYNNGTTPNFFINQPQPPPSTIIVITNTNSNNSDETFCPHCKSKTQSLPRRSVGRVTIAWSFVLTFVGIACCLCFIPFCNDDCKDLEIVCVNCQNVKQTVYATCC